jgi:hypothetical protein
MKTKIKSFILLLTAFTFIFSIIYQGCKSDSTVQPPVNNNQTPSGPVLISPNNESTSNFLATTFVWQSFPSAVSYQLQISLDANFAGTMIVDTSGITGTQQQVFSNRLTTNVYYYWRVKARISSNNFSSWSSTWRFNIILNAPAAPNLIAPSNGAQNQSFTPLLQWSMVDSAQFYRVQISRLLNFSTLTFDSNHILINQLTVPVFYLSSGQQYFWRANASNSNGLSTSQWSGIFNFTTLSGPEPNSISGTITFVDTNFLSNIYYYIAAAYTSWPPGQYPIQSDSIIIRKIGNIYQANYLIQRLYNGNYYIAVNLGPLPIAVLGIYGCDTVHTQYSGCPNNPTTVQITNNFGLVNINFLSWADTSKKIF